MSNRSMADLKAAMQTTFQTPDQSVWQHGESVLAHFDDLYRHLAYGEPLVRQWRLPDWVSGDLLDRLLPIDTVREYLLWHDVGKPQCRVVDADGRQHFPDHAAVSERAWLTAGGDPVVGHLIGMDMVVHTLRGGDIANFAAQPESITLLLAGLSEIHSNAAMFGGIESTNFKIKWKNLNKFGRRIVENQS